MIAEQTDMFEKARAAEKQLNGLFQRINEIRQMQTKLLESHANSERKLREVTSAASTTNADDKQEQLIVAQVWIAFTAEALRDIAATRTKTLVAQVFTFVVVDHTGDPA